MMKVENIISIKIIVGLFSGLFLQISGVIMIFRDLQGYGNISVKSLLLNANISATDIGLLVIFLGTIIQIFAIMRRIRGENTIEKKKNGESIYVKERSRMDGGNYREKYVIERSILDDWNYRKKLR